MTRDDLEYAIENTRVILAPQRRIETFGDTQFRFYLISELMDSVNKVRVRDGRIHAQRPQIVAPGQYMRLLLEGFGEKAREFADLLEQNHERLTFLKYGFQFRKSEVNEHVIHDSMEAVIGRIREDVEDSQDPLSAILQGVDDAWEVCLLQFTIDLIQKSAGGNMGDFRKRGLL